MNDDPARNHRPSNTSRLTRRGLVKSMVGAGLVAPALGGLGPSRALAAPLLRIEASPRGFLLRPLGGRGVAVLAPPIDGEQASLLAILADGAAWPTSALALALGASQRTVQRALAELEAGGRVRSIGKARSQRWLAPPLTGITTNLLLPVLLPQG